MKILPFLHSRSIFILVLCHLILFNVVNYSNQIKSIDSFSNKGYEAQPIIDRYKDLFGCKKTRIYNLFNMEFGLCENCRDMPLEEECYSIPVYNSSYQLISYTSGFDKRSHEIQEYNKTISAVEKDLLGDAILLSGNFVNISGAENCSFDENSQIELLQEIYLIYNQQQKSGDLALNIKLGNPSLTNESGNFEIISNWNMNNKKSSHAMFAYTKFTEKVRDIKSEINSNLDSIIFNKVWTSINVAYNSKNVQNFDQFKPCMRISCYKTKRDDQNNRTGDANGRITVRDIIDSVILLKSKVKSENDYLIYVNIMIKTLLKSLERKTKRGKISNGCSVKMASWVRELCEILGIKTDESSSMGKFISKFVRVKKELDYSKEFKNGTSTVESEQNSGFKQAELEDYDKLEKELKEF